MANWYEQKKARDARNNTEDREARICRKIREEMGITPAPKYVFVQDDKGGHYEEEGKIDDEQTEFEKKYNL